MKKLTDFLKRNALIITGLIAWSFLVAYLSVNYIHNDPQDPITSLVSDKVEEFKNNLKEDNARVETNKSESISGISLEQYNKLKAQYNSKSIEFNSFTNTYATLKDSLKMARLTIDELNNKIWSWETIKTSGSIIKATMNEKDSILHASVDVKLNITDVVDKGGIFKKDKFYTDFYSPDQNIKINGVQNFRKEIVVKPKRIGLGIQFGYGVSDNFKVAPYIGLGISYNFLNL